MKECGGKWDADTEWRGASAICEDDSLHWSEVFGRVAGCNESHMSRRSVPPLPPRACGCWDHTDSMYSIYLDIRAGRRPLWRGPLRDDEVMF